MQGKSEEEKGLNIQLVEIYIETNTFIMHTANYYNLNGELSFVAHTCSLTLLLNNLSKRTLTFPHQEFRLKREGHFFRISATSGDWRMQNTERDIL